MSGIRKDRVKRLFNGSAARYDRISDFQRDISGQLILFFPDIFPSSGVRVLDVGCGTGNLGLRLSRQAPKGQIFGCDIAFRMAETALRGRNGSPRYFAINGDAEILPVRSGSFDLAVSNLAFQWMADYGRAVRECHRVLRSGGRLVYSVFGEGTLSELKEAYRHSQNGSDLPGTASRLHPFPGRDDTVRRLAEAGFGRIRVIEKTYLRYYDGAFHLLNLLKNLGASNAVDPPSGGLGNRGWIQKMVRYYDSNFSSSAGVAATWVVHFVEGYRT
jgi:malonyl-CoA O-methyltransferase